MTLTLADRVFETSTTQGTGTLNLAGAPTGFQTFVAGAGDASEVPYIIDDGADWEIGIGTVTSGSPDTLSRDTIYASSNSDAAVNWSTGTRNVRLGMVATQTPMFNRVGTWTASQTFNAAVILSGKTSLPDGGELTIATGAITVTGGYHTVDTESDAASDDLDTISGGSDGELLILSAEHTDRTVVLKHNTGNILTQDGNDVTLDDTTKRVVLQYDDALSKYVVLASPIVVDNAFSYNNRFGCNIANDTTDTQHDIKITAGKRRNHDDTVNLTLESDLIKQADASFTAGNNQGGLSSSLTLLSDTWYHVFLVKIGSSIDVLFDTDFDCANGIADHSVTDYRHIGDFLTDGSADILGFTKIGNRVVWKTLSVDSNISATSGTGTLGTIKVPPNQNVKAQLTANTQTAGNQQGTLISSPLSDDVAAVWNSGGAIINIGGQTNTGSYVGDVAYVEVITNTSKQVRARTTTSTLTVYITTHGWEYIE